MITIVETDQKAEMHLFFFFGTLLSKVRQRARQLKAEKGGLALRALHGTCYTPLYLFRQRLSCTCVHPKVELKGFLVVS